MPHTKRDLEVIAIAALSIKTILTKYGPVFRKAMEKTKGIDTYRYDTGKNGIQLYYYGLTRTWYAELYLKGKGTRKLLIPNESMEKTDLETRVEDLEYNIKKLVDFINDTRLNIVNGRITRE